ncbi:MAG: hypothetical protein R2875_08060 [Desulfobacterales bacterium]
MSNTSRKPPNRLHFLRMKQLLFYFFLSVKSDALKMASLSPYSDVRLLISTGIRSPAPGPVQNFKNQFFVMNNFFNPGLSQRSENSPCRYPSLFHFQKLITFISPEYSSGFMIGFYYMAIQIVDINGMLLLKVS